MNATTAKRLNGTSKAAANGHSAAGAIVATETNHDMDVGRQGAPADAALVDALRAFAARMLAEMRELRGALAGRLRDRKPLADMAVINGPRLAELEAVALAMHRHGYNAMVEDLADGRLDVADAETRLKKMREAAARDLMALGIDCHPLAVPLAAVAAARLVRE